MVFAFTKDFQLVKCWHLQLGSVVHAMHKCVEIWAIIHASSVYNFSALSIFIRVEKTRFFCFVFFLSKILCFF